MPTIQIRDVPEETYDKIRLRARAAGQSIQLYMRDQLIQLADRRTKQEIWESVRSSLASEQGVDADRIVAELDADRR